MNYTTTCAFNTIDKILNIMQKQNFWIAELIDNKNIHILYKKKKQKKKQ